MEPAQIVKPTPEEIARILESHRKWLTGEPGGSRANLSFANLSFADLSYADLSFADLSYANLRSANLRSADLSSANLRSANLRSANLSSANLPTGEKWERYLAEVLPALLTAGGKTLEEIVAAGAWDCHSWANCPMHAAFDAGDLGETPVLLWPRVEQFIQFFDAKLLGVPVKTDGGSWNFPAAVVAPAAPTPAPAEAKDAT